MHGHLNFKFETLLRFHCTSASRDLKDLTVQNGQIDHRLRDANVDSGV